ncbi:hypothetical protein GJAV_G00130260 [Gymnothorax javanicus]|nr:hypothetical protein GJAV_G00130260 [Gymnothorax javanicus]
MKGIGKERGERFNGGGWNEGGDCLKVYYTEGAKAGEEKKTGGIQRILKKTRIPIRHIIPYSDTMAAKTTQPYIILPLVLALSSVYAEKHRLEGNGTKTRIRPRTFEGLGLNPDEDYSVYDDPTPQPPDISTPPMNGKPQRCDYDPCRDQQQPCVELLAISGCQCPGLSGPHQLPEAPFLKQIVQQGTEVVVEWCAPSSTVSYYQVEVEGKEPLMFTGVSRRAVLKDLKVGERVCVKAGNNAGVSSPQQHSCTRYQPESDGNLALKAGLIGGAVGFLLLLSLVIFLLWRKKACRKSRG